MRMFKIGLGFAFGALSFIYAGRAGAATFSTWCPETQYLSGGCVVIMNGQIVKGDKERLLTALRTPVPRPGFFKTLVLDSPGGDVQEAFNLSDIVVRGALDTSTVDPSKPPLMRAKNSCVSACFLVWVAGVDRFQGSYGKDGLGLHRPYFSAETYNQQDAGTAAQRQQEVSLKVRAYLRRFEVPDALIDTMMSRSSKDVYWVSAGDDPFVMSGRAPWFEELMIARCKFDPVYDADEQAWSVQTVVNNRLADQKRLDTYFAWRRSYNTCEYAFREASLKKVLTP